MKKNYKRILCLALAAVMVMALAACGKKEESGEKDLLDQIKERGYIIVGTEGTYPPNTYHDAEDKLVGFDVEVAALVAKYIGVEVRYVETEWSSIFAALDAGQPARIHQPDPRRGGKAPAAFDEPAGQRGGGDGGV